ncbi:hypothetical protein HVH02_003998 [Salmonella enterica]|nr:hypothetical protein [Salmonella enterica]
MKRVNTSLKKTGIIFSLVLLSPAVMAAENLNFNYTRADALSLNPRLSLQAKACHSKGDPMILNFRVSGILVASGYEDGLHISLKVKGEAYEKSFDVFSAPGSPHRMKLGARNTGPEFQVPWSVSASGVVTGVNGSIVGKVSVPEQVSYGDPFCFTKDGLYNPTGFVNTHHFIPIYRNAPYAQGAEAVDDSLFRRYCGRFGFSGNVSEQDGGGEYYWPSSSKYPAYPLPAPDYIQRKIDAEKDDPHYGPLLPHPYLVNTLFFRKKYVIPAIPANPHFAATAYDPDAHLKDATIDRLTSIGPDTYLVPLSTKEDVATLLDNANVSVRLGNRNITSMSLIFMQQIGHAKRSYTFEWVRDSTNSNVLRYQGASGDLNNIKAGKNDSSTDPYAAHQFYPTDVSGFFKGTLVNSLGLTQAYKDYVNNIMPLSLPSDMTGNINLVNTDSLIFTIEKGDQAVDPVDLGLESYSVRITGQPLKFAPLRVNGKVAASAMQIRNACY